MKRTKELKKRRVGGSGNEKLKEIRKRAKVQ